MARAVFLNRLGEIRDRSYENQRYRASGLNLVVAVFGCVGLAKHPSAERLICLVGPVGMTLYCVSHWKKARMLLAGSRCSWTQATLLLALTMMGSGPTLGDMYHRKEMELFTPFGMGELVVVAICLALLGSELFGDWQAGRRAKDQAVSPWSEPQE